MGSKVSVLHRKYLIFTLGFLYFKDFMVFPLAPHMLKLHLVKQSVSDSRIVNHCIIVAVIDRCDPQVTLKRQLIWLMMTPQNEDN